MNSAKSTSIDWNSYFNEDGYYSLVFQLVFSFILGLILAPFSVGLFIFIVFYILFELFYANRKGFRYTQYELLIRFLIFLVGLLGFLVGRVASGDSHPFRHHYDQWDL
jgi:hypothetical protein